MVERKIDIKVAEEDGAKESVRVVNQFIDVVANFDREEIPEVIYAFGRIDESNCDFILSYDRPQDDPTIERVVVWQVDLSAYKIDEVSLFPRPIILQRNEGNPETLVLKTAEPIKGETPPNNFQVSHYGLTEINEKTDELMDEELYTTRLLEPDAFVRTFTPLFSAYLNSWVSAFDEEDYD